MFLNSRWKQNPVETALLCDHSGLGNKVAGFKDFQKFLRDNYQIKNLTHVLSFVCNKFFLGTDKNGVRLFIKTGAHAGIYENEYKMGRALYDIDNEHFFEPMYYNDFAQYNFFANPYIPNTTLKTAIMNNSLTPEQKAQAINEI